MHWWIKQKWESINYLKLNDCKKLTFYNCIKSWSTIRINF